MKGFFAQHKWVLAAGGAMGAAGALLAYLGNPVNTGICISCFLENVAGALGLHGNPRMIYLRPEIPGFLVGAFLMALLGREYRPRGSSQAAAQFFLGVLMILGSAVFIGCPIKLVLRLAGGDMTALWGAAGLVAGVWAGIFALRRMVPVAEGRREPISAIWPTAVVALSAILALLPAVANVFPVSRVGGGAMHAPPLASLGVALGVGALCQRSRFCVTGSLRDMILTRRFSMGAGLLAALAAALVLNGALGLFHPGYADQPGVHLEWAWAVAGMGLTGWAAVLAGGCPFRQLVKAGEGDGDALIASAGMLFGAILVQQWELYGTSAGVTPQAKGAILLGFAALAGTLIAKRKGG